MIGLPMNLLLGGWFFKQRGIKRSGEKLGWLGAVLLTGIALFLLAITMIVLFNAFRRH
jgi:Zn-dependent membrane protease YugP